MSEQKTILLVDDDVNLVEALSATFQNAGYIVHKAFCGEDGLAKAREIQPSVILLDVMMGEKHGFKVCEELKKDPLTSSIGILIFSAMSGMNDPKYHRGIGLDTLADDFLEKPMKPSEVLKQVELLIARG